MNAAQLRAELRKDKELMGTAAMQLVFTRLINLCDLLDAPATIDPTAISDLARHVTDLPRAEAEQECIEVAAARRSEPATEVKVPVVGAWVWLADQLEALPVKAAVLDGYGDVWQLRHVAFSGARDRRRWFCANTFTESKSSVALLDQYADMTTGHNRLRVVYLPDDGT